MKLDYSECKATNEEKSPAFLKELYPDFFRDKRKRINVCDCAGAYRAATGVAAPDSVSRTGRDEAFADVPVQATSSGMCPYCGYYARLSVSDGNSTTSTRGRNGRAPSVIDKEQLKNMIDASLSYAAIARQLGVAKETVRKYAIVHGLTKPSKEEV